MAGVSVCPDVRSEKCGRRLSLNCRMEENRDGTGNFLNQKGADGMKHISPILIILAAILLAGLACSAPSPSGVQSTADAISTEAAATVNAIQTQAATIKAIAPTLFLPKVTLKHPILPKDQTPTVNAATGSISGAIKQPGIPDAMRIYWREVNSGHVGYIETVKTDTTYTISGLAAGDYNVVSWFWPQGSSGAVTSLNMVSANTSAQQQNCKASLKKIHLNAGQDVTGADIGCWGGDFFYLVTPAAP
jgi:hypothetical protein